MDKPLIRVFVIRLKSSDGLCGYDLRFSGRPNQTITLSTESQWGEYDLTQRAQINGCDPLFKWKANKKGEINGKYKNKV